MSTPKSTPKYTQTLPGLPRATNPKTPTKPKRFKTVATPKAVKGNAFAIRNSLLKQQVLPGKKEKNIQPIERIKQPLEKIKPGLNKEMKHAILLDVPGLIEKRLPDTLFQRLACPQPLIIVVDGSKLLPHVDSDRDTSTTVTDDDQHHPYTADVQDAPNSSRLPEQQRQANEGIATVEADDNQHPQNGGDGEEPAAVDTHAATVSDNSPSIDPHPLSDLSRPSTPSASVSSTEPIVPFPGVKEIFKHLSDKESEPLDYAETIRDLYKAGYYHRDISDKNLIIVPDDDSSPAETDSLPAKNNDSPTRTGSLSKENDESPTKIDDTHRVGFLIDLDCATEVVHMRGATAELTGTLPFMPIEMLENYGCEHKYIETLEKARDGLAATDFLPAPNDQSNRADTNDHSAPLAMKDKSERRVRRALTAKRLALVEVADDVDDDSSVESEPDDKRKDPDYIDHGYISPTAGRGRQSRTIGSLLSTKRPGPNLGSLTKRRRTTSARAKASRS
ncbi:hypothetical protein ACEPAG_2399 [Sanghuangporus baumii]